MNGVVNQLLLTTNESNLRITTLILNGPEGIERQLPKDEQKGVYRSAAT